MKQILFTGHMIDAEGRGAPRFPATKEKAVRDAIRQKLITHIKNYGRSLTAIAGGASGGDILLHELCMELEIPSKLYLALPPDQFKSRSVSFAGKDWEDRFDSLIDQLPYQILTPDNSSAENLWAQANLWMLDEALISGSENAIVLALWDTGKADGSGGTEDIIRIAKASGVETDIIDIRKL